MAPEESLICGGNFPKRINRVQSLCQILHMFTIEIVINSIHVHERMHVTISCRYALSRLGWCFWFLV